MARLTRQQVLFDLALAAIGTALVLAVTLSGVESVPANRPVGPVVVVLTVLAVAPIALRRRYPTAVLVATLLAGLALVVTRSTVGLSTLGPLVAMYTAVTYQSRRRAWLATAILVTGLAVAALLRPVDLSFEGAVVQSIVFAGTWLLARAARERRELFAAGLDRAKAEAARERDRADAERERALRTATEERLRISRELHDVVGHALSVVVVQAGVAEQLVDRRPDQARQAVAEIARTGRQSLDEIRRLLGVLRDEDGVDGGTAPDDLVTVRHRPGSVEVEIVDDGRATASPVATGHGLAGMRERVRVYGGDFAAGPRSGGGFGVRARFPLADPTGADPTAAGPSTESA